MFGLTVVAKGRARKSLFTSTLLLVTLIGSSQTIIDWSPDYKIQLSDFQSAQTEINEKLSSYSIFSGTGIDFSFHMTSGQFLFTKNFNSKVRNTFDRKAAVITAPDTLTALFLVEFGQYNFDLTELYSRKFRKELYEQKGAFSDVNFFQPIYQKLQEEMNQEAARVLKASDLGTNREMLASEHQKVLQQISELADFCRECTPPKSRKKK